MKPERENSDNEISRKIMPQHLSYLAYCYECTKHGYKTKEENDYYEKYFNMKRKPRSIEALTHRIHRKDEYKPTGVAK